MEVLAVIIIVLILIGTAGDYAEGGYIKKNG